MASYIVWYTLGRFWIEALRIDAANTLGGFRLNSYTSGIVFVAGLALLIWLLRTRPGLVHGAHRGPHGAGGRGRRGPLFLSLPTRPSAMRQNGQDRVRLG